MNLNINNTIPNGTPDAWSVAPATSANANAAPASAPAPASTSFTVTNTPASPEDVAAASIPPSALTRDDPLGLLVSSAFNLPPPALPDFSGT